MPKTTAQKVTITILGCGTSTGVPVIGCPCAVCSSTDPRNKRTRTSLMITNDAGEHLVFDTTPEFRLQMLRENVRRLSHVIFTHLHADHCHGLDDLRSFYFQQKHEVACYVGAEGLPEFRSRFAYVFDKPATDGAKPRIRLETLPEGTFEILGLLIEPITLPHGSLVSHAFRIGNFAYATDFKSFNNDDIARWKGRIDTMVASGVYFGTHNTHSTIDETLLLFERLGVKRGILTHLSHEVDFERDSRRLPSHVAFAVDGMKFDFELRF